MSLQWRLNIMMFLQFAVWGVWAVNLGPYLLTLEDFREDSGTKLTMIFLTMAIASMLAPMIAGQFVDRFFATEKYLAFSHLAAGGLMFWASRVTDFSTLFWVMLAHCFFYAPTVPLTNSLSMFHLKDPETEFPKVRVYGTIGWMAVGWAFGGWLLLGQQGFSTSLGDCLAAAGVLGIVMAIFSFFALPHTPPQPKARDASALTKAFGLLKDRSFAVLVLIAFLVSTELQFYYTLTPNFFGAKAGPSLSLRQTMQAGGLEGKGLERPANLVEAITTGVPRTIKQAIAPTPAELDPGTAAATTMMQAFDSIRDNRLMKQELEEAATRQGELQALAGRIGGSEGDFDVGRLEGEARETNLATDKRSAKDIASYAVKAADGNADGKLAPAELQKFLDKLNPLMPTVPTVLTNFDSYATDKGGLTLPDYSVPWVMTIGQFAEIFVLLILPWSLKRFGFGPTIAFGIAAWALRYGAFALGNPVPLVVTSQALHGFGFAFFFVGAMLYADRVATSDIRASAQALIIFVTYGAGMVISSLVAGPIADYYEFDWHKIFLVPVIITVICVVVFLLLFRERNGPIDAPTTTNADA